MALGFFKCSFTGLGAPAIELVNVIAASCQSTSFSSITADAIHAGAGTTVSGAQIRDDKFSKISGSCVNLLAGQSVHVVNCSMKQPGAAAIAAIAADCEFSGNVISKPAGHGIIATGDLDDASDNKISSPQGDGIH